MAKMAIGSTPPKIVSSPPKAKPTAAAPSKSKELTKTLAWSVEGKAQRTVAMQQARALVANINGRPTFPVMKLAEYEAAVKTLAQSPKENSALLKQAYGKLMAHYEDLDQTETVKTYAALLKALPN